MSKKDLYPLNQMMTYPTTDVTPNSQQASYPLLHLFHHLTLAGNLLHKVGVKGGKFRLERTAERYDQYQFLTDTEKYFFLFETFWVDCDWGNFEPGTYRSASFSFLLPVFNALGKKDAGYKIVPGAEEWEESYISNSLLRWGYYLHYFSYFGFWEVTLDGEPDKNRSKWYVPAKSVTLTNLGVQMMKILSEYRLIDNWNIPYNRQNGSRATFAADKDETEPFISAFMPLFAEGELQETLPRLTTQWQDGTYVFKVSLASNIWRRVQLAANHTFADFHSVIQKAFDFDDDHLYAFFMDGRRWSYDAVWSPNADDQPVADEVRLGESGLLKGKRFLYLFDFGDEWTFNVTLEGVMDNEPQPVQLLIVEKKGTAPGQYAW